MKSVLLLVLAACFACNTSGSKILAIFPTPCKSHYILGESLLRGLVNKGHHVTMMSPYGLDNPIPNYNHVTIEGTEDIKKNYWSKLTNINIKPWQKLGLLRNIFTLLPDVVHSSANVQKFRKSGEKFDLCIVSFMMMESMYAVCNEVQAPAIGFSLVGLSGMLTYHTQNPVPYAYVPNPFLSLTDEMSFLERVLNTVTWISSDAFNKFMFMPQQANFVKKYYPNSPPLDELLDNVDLYFLNSHISTDSPKALLPNTIPIGGFHLEIMDNLTKDTKEFLDKSKKGVIYFNLGTNAKSSELDQHILTAILKTFSKLDYNVLWKFEGELSNKPKNVRIEKWLPQRKVLMHPNVKIFMTHGGLGGIVEAVYGGVPMICMPIFGDQGKNCADSVNNGYAVLLKLVSVTEENLMESIKEIETNPTYKQNIMLKSDLYRHQEVNPMDKAIFWIEHVIKHKGAKHLKSKATSLAWYQYYLIDVVIFLFGILFALLLITKYLLKLLLCVFKFAVSNKTNKVKKQ